MNGKPQTLDPKMKAIYDQVMSTVVTRPQNPITAPGPKVNDILANTPLTNPVSVIPTTKYPLPVSAVPLTTQQDLQPSLTDPATIEPRPSLITEQIQDLGRPNIPTDKGLYGTLSPTPPSKSPTPTMKVSSYTSDTPAPDEKDKGKNHSPIIPILFVISGMIFFVVYTIFWIKFFHLPVSFLPI